MNPGVIDRTVEAEQTVIGALLLAAPGLRVAALDELTDDDFTDLRCRFAFTTARRMVADGVPIDPDRTTSVPVPAHLPWYVTSVVESASRRRISEAGRRLDEVAAVASVTELSTVVGLEMTAMTVALGRLRAVANA